MKIVNFTDHQISKYLNQFDVAEYMYEGYTVWKDEKSNIKLIVVYENDDKKLQVIPNADSANDAYENLTKELDQFYKYSSLPESLHVCAAEAVAELESMPNHHYKWQLNYLKDFCKRWNDIED